MGTWRPGDTLPLPGIAYTSARVAVAGFIGRKFSEMAVLADLDSDATTSVWTGRVVSLRNSQELAGSTQALVATRASLMRGTTEVNVAIQGALHAVRTYRTREPLVGDYGHNTAEADAIIKFVLGQMVQLDAEATWLTVDEAAEHWDAMDVAAVLAGGVHMSNNILSVMYSTTLLKED
jgi:hypothetical protein